MYKAAIVIPSYEPDDRLIDLLKELEKKEMGPIYIVDDGSGEEYTHYFESAKDILGRTGGRIITHEVNRGKGRALKTAFSYILEQAPEIEGVVTADSDGQHTPDCIRKIMTSLGEHPKALVLGVRRFDLEGVPWKSRAGNSITEHVFRYVSGVHITDTQTGLRGIPADYMRQLLDLAGDRFEFEMRMLVDAAEKMEIVQVPIETVYDSKENHQTHFNSFKDSVRIYRILAEKFGRYIFSSLSSALLDLVLFYVLCRLLKTARPLSYAAIATAAARVISAAYNFSMNNWFVFKSKQRVAASAVKFFILAVLQMGCSAGLITLAIQLFPGGPELVFKMIIDTVLFFLSYMIQQKLVFQKVSF